MALDAETRDQLIDTVAEVERWLEEHPDAQRLPRVVGRHRYRLGDVDEERSVFPEGIEVGMQFEGVPEGAVTPGLPEDVVYTVTEVYPTHVVLDGNHPLAGVALRLHLTVQDVRQATSDEIDAGSVGQPAFSVFNADPPGPHLH